MILRFHPLTTLLLLVLFSPLAQGQNNKTASTEAARLRQEVTAVNAVPSHFASDSGTIVPADDSSQSAKLFKVGFHQDLMWYSNATLIKNGAKKGDAVYLPAVDVSFYKTLGSGFAANAYLRHDTFLYQDNTALNMWGTFSRFSLDYTYKDKWPTLYVGSELYRYEALNSGQEITRAVNFITGFDHGISLPVQGLSMIYGYRFAQIHSAPNINNSTNHRGILGFSYEINSKWNTQITYIFENAEYSKVVREDTRNILAWGLNYKPYDWLSVRVTSSFADNDSNSALFEYQNISAGAGSSMSIAF
ncbi:MAG: hypothetical protein SFY92_07870 [Verrucomicrobiae bacterium]|nr:hypothetical protein [Verrucomicrobiae bacterium]